MLVHILHFQSSVNRCHSGTAAATAATTATATATATTATTATGRATTTTASATAAETDLAVGSASCERYNPENYLRCSFSREGFELGVLPSKKVKQNMRDLNIHPKLLVGFRSRTKEVHGPSSTMKEPPVSMSWLNFMYHFITALSKHNASFLCRIAAFLPKKTELVFRFNDLQRSDSEVRFFRNLLPDLNTWRLARFYKSNLESREVMWNGRITITLGGYIPGFLHGPSIWVADMCHRITAKSGLGHHNFWLVHHFINAGFIFLPRFGEEFHFGKYVCWKWVGTTTLVLKNSFFYSNKSVLDCFKKAMNHFLQQGI